MDFSIVSRRTHISRSHRPGVGVYCVLLTAGSSLPLTCAVSDREQDMWYEYVFLKYTSTMQQVAATAATLILYRKNTLSR